MYIEDHLCSSEVLKSEKNMLVLFIIGCLICAYISPVFLGRLICVGFLYLLYKACF